MTHRPRTVEAMADMSELRRKVQRRAETLHSAAGKLLADQLARELPRETGRLADSARYQGPRRLSETHITGALMTDAEPYDEYVEKGTRPHVIRPVRRQALRFNVAGGRTVFATKVNHPGTKPGHQVRNKARDWGRALRAASFLTRS